jgi:hypothetical protein
MVAPARILSADDPALSAAVRSVAKRQLVEQHIAGELSEDDLGKILFELDLADA